MRIAYFDTIAGISGDMTLGAFVSAGVRVDELISELAKLGLSGFELQASHAEHSGISATKIDVVTSEQHVHRDLTEINRMIEGSALSATTKERAISIFRTIAIAEAKIHNTTLEKVHFHEVGAIDSLVDIVGAAICIEKLGIKAVYSSPVRLGSAGFVESEHGRLPVPTPATVEILRGYPILLTDIPFELTTPTGAGIIKSLSRGVLTNERIKVETIGYGAGTREIPSLPNLLRILVGEIDPVYESDEIVTVETNIDDMNPEIYPYVIEQLMNAGAHDAFVVPIVMKKGRPGMMLSILLERAKLDPVLSILFRETTTLGVRIQPIERRKLPRSQREVQTSLGTVKAKVIARDGKETFVPEFEECKRLALEKNLPLKDVYKVLEREFSKEM